MKMLVRRTLKEGDGDIVKSSRISSYVIGGGEKSKRIKFWKI